jgi:hypothetical protein
MVVWAPGLVLLATCLVVLGWHRGLYHRGRRLALVLLFSLAGGLSGTLHSAYASHLPYRLEDPKAAHRFVELPCYSAARYCKTIDARPWLRDRVVWVHRVGSPESLLMSLAGARVQLTDQRLCDPADVAAHAKRRSRWIAGSYELVLEDRADAWFAVPIGRTYRLVPMKDLEGLLCSGPEDGQ